MHTNENVKNDVGFLCKITILYKMLEKHVGEGKNETELNCGRCTYEEVTEREIRSCKRIKNSETKGMDNSETEEA